MGKKIAAALIMLAIIISCKEEEKTEYRMCITSTYTYNGYEYIRTSDTTIVSSDCQCECEFDYFEKENTYKDSGEYGNEYVTICKKM